MARAQPAVRGIGMKPTDSAAPASRLRRLVVPALPATIVLVAGLALATGVLVTLGKGDALFPGASIGWSLAILTGVIVGHLVALGRDRWWGGTAPAPPCPWPSCCSTAGCPPPSSASPSSSWSAPPGVIAGDRPWCTVPWTSSASAPRRSASPRSAWSPASATPGPRRPGTSPSSPKSSSPPPATSSSAADSCGSASPAHRPAARHPRTAVLRQALVGIALLGISPLIAVCALHAPLLLPLFAVPLIALDSTLWIARARAEEQLRDPLTGLPNRQWLLERTWTALDDAERVGSRSALVLIDLDRFRSVNDTLGHLAGDRLLLQIADRLRHALPRGAEAARLGGDEFAVLLPTTDSLTSSQRVARSLVAALGSPLDLDGLTLVLEASAGVAVFPDHALDAEGLLRRADVAMYQAKRDRSGSSSTRPSGTATPPTASACWAICAAPWTPATSSCTTSPRSASTDTSPGWRHWSAGCIRTAAGCHPTNSSPSPSPPG